MNQQLQDLGYLRLPGFISAVRAGELAQELARSFAREGEAFDRQVPDAPYRYNFAPIVRLLVARIPELGEACGEPLLPTYAYARAYRRGSRLPRHCDRPACEISLTVHLRGDRPWAFHLQNFGMPVVDVTLAPGDALMYLGHQVEHWREPYEGDEHLQMFLHYVRARGPHAWAVFDREQRAP